jgi:hypothetical protein
MQSIKIKNIPIISCKPKKKRIKECKVGKISTVVTHLLKLEKLIDYFSTIFDIKSLFYSKTR